MTKDKDYNLVLTLNQRKWGKLKIHDEHNVIDGETYYYWAKWSELKREHKRRGLGGFDDVRCAGGVLEDLGIPFTISIAGTNEKNQWIIFWR